MSEVRDSAVAPRTKAATNDHLITLVELLFFAYRDFTAEADEILAEYKLGRAHHRVLHFVRRHPGLRVTDLLSILKITKQSLGRVLGELIVGGWIESRAEAEDRRARRLAVTARGDALALRLARHQVEQVSAALGGHATVTNNRSDLREEPVRRFLLAMIADDERDRVRALMGATEKPGS